MNSGFFKRCATCVACWLLWSLFLCVPVARAQYSMGASVVGAGATEATHETYTLRGTVGQAVVGQTSGGEVDLWQGFWYVRGGLLPPSRIFANLKVLLEGPYAGGGTMTTSLNPTHLPLTQPYDGSEFIGTPKYYPGLESVTSMPAAAVDWILVEVRTGTAATDSVTSRAGVVLNTGLIRDTDGTSLLGFTDLPVGDYYLVVRHRNHLAIMSSSVIAMNTSPALYNFTDSQAKAYKPGAQDPMADLGGGLYGLIACDANLDRTVNYFNPFTGDDRTAILTALAGDVTGELTGYHTEDVQLDGKVNYFNPFTGDDRTAILTALSSDVTAELGGTVPE